jgi:hypothetical protein
MLRRVDDGAGSGEMQPPQLKPPRGVTIGIAVELFGIALAVFGLTLDYGYGTGITVRGNPVVAGLGVLVALLGLVMHTARV